MKTMGVSLFVLALVAAGSGAVVAQDGGEYVPITPENTDQVVQVAMVERAGVMHVSWSPDGKTLAVSSWEGGIWLYDAANLSAEPRLIGDAMQFISDVAFTPDGMSIVSEGWIDDSFFGSLQLWDVETGELLQGFGKHVEGMRSMAFSPDGSLLASNCLDRHVCLWDMATGYLLDEVEPPVWWRTTFGPFVLGLDYSSKEHLIAYSTTGHDVAYIIILDVETLENRILLKDDVYFGFVVFSPDSTMLAVEEIRGDRQGSSIRLIDSVTGETLQRFGRYDGWIPTITFNADGSLLALSDRHHSLDLWNVATGEKLAVLGSSSVNMCCSSFSPDGTLIASVGLDNTIQLWGIPAQE